MRWANWLIGACCALYVGVILVPTGLYGGVWGLVSGEHAADWAQFFAAFVALGIAVGSPILQHRSQRARERREEADRRRTALALIEQVVILIMGRPTFRVGEIEEMSRILDRIDVGAFPPEAVGPFVEIHAAVTQASKEVDRKFIANTDDGLYAHDFDGLAAGERLVQLRTAMLSDRQAAVP